MARFEVCIVESRDLVFEVEASTAEEASAIALDLDTTDAARDSFRERTLDWSESL